MRACIAMHRRGRLAEMMAEIMAEIMVEMMAEPQPTGTTATAAARPSEPAEGSAPSEALKVAVTVTMAVVAPGAPSWAPTARSCGSSSR